MPFAATWMELKSLILSEVNQKRERQIAYDITYIWNLIYDTNKPFHRKETHGFGEQICGCQGAEGGEWDGMAIWGQQMQTIALGMDKQ